MSILKFSLNSFLNQTVAKQSELPLQVRAVNILNIFRLVLSLIFIGLYLLMSKEIGWHKETDPLFFNLSVSYFIFSLISLFISRLKFAAHPYLLPMQVLVDILFITLIMHAAGGAQSGLGLLLIISIVTASLVSPGRLALFYAAVASICLLTEQSYQIVIKDLSNSSYTQTVMPVSYTHLDVYKRQGMDCSR